MTKYIKIEDLHQQTGDTTVVSLKSIEPALKFWQAIVEYDAAGNPYVSSREGAIALKGDGKTSANSMNIIVWYYKSGPPVRFPAIAGQPFQECRKWPL